MDKHGKNPVALSEGTLVIGRGRLATQLIHYLGQLGEPFTVWNRIQSPEELYKKSIEARRVLLPISDKAISEFLDENEALFREKYVIHFSAAQIDSRALGFHPLGSFTTALNVDFAKVHFHGAHPESVFREALPMFHNTYTELSGEDMQRYHALCVLGGNYTALLWKTFFEESLRLGIPQDALVNYFDMVSNNILVDPKKAITGPLVRGDHQTIEKNLAALSHEPKLRGLYAAFVTAFKDEQA